MRQLSSPLLRSIIRFGQEDEATLSANLYHIRHEVEPGAIDQHIFEFISDIYDKTHIIPDIALLTKHYRELESQGDGNGVAGLARLSMLVEGDPIRAITMLAGTEFRYELDRFKNEMLREETSNMLLQAGSILGSGARVDGQQIQGALPALQFLTDRMNLLTSSLKRGSIEGSFRRDASIVRKQYEHWKNTPTDTVGVLTGIDKFDVAHRGVKNGDLCLVLGFVSQLKTSFVLNWLYKAAVHFNRNVGIASLEMPVSTLRVLMYVMHTGHIKFKEQGFSPLDYDKVTTGSLTEDEEQFFRLVIDDFENSKEYGEIYYKEPEASITIPEIQRWAEKKHAVTPLDMLVVDYFGLVDPGKGQSGMDSMAALNKVCRQAKIMAMTFGSGRGIPVVSPWQANRAGFTEAEKNGGRYKLTAMAGANEAERASDFIYYTYLDDMMRNTREVLLGNLKARNSQVITEPFRAFADPSIRMIDNLAEGAGPQDLVQI